MEDFKYREFALPTSGAGEHPAADLGAAVHGDGDAFVLVLRDASRQFQTRWTRGTLRGRRYDLDGGVATQCQCVPGVSRRS
jgi:hypothetical protein